MKRIGPTFIVIGAAKAGTTALHRQLGAHPDVFVTDPKEPHFFSDTPRYERGMDWYRSLFDGSDDHSVAGEFSVSYAITGVYPWTVDRIADAYPDVKLIFMVRSPLARLESFYIEWRHGNVPRWAREYLGSLTIPEDFETALRTTPHFVDSTHYLRQIAAFETRFDREQMMVVFNEDYRDRQAETYADVCRFLGVDPDVEATHAATTANSWTSKRQDREMMRTLRSVPGFELVRGSLPRGFRRAVRSVTTVPVEGRPEWTVSALDWARDEFLDGSIALLQREGRSPEMWSFDDPAAA